MSHKIVIMRQPSGGTSLTESAEAPTYTFEYTPPHDQTPAQAGEQFAKVQKFLEKAVNAANGEPTE